MPSAGPGAAAPSYSFAPGGFTHSPNGEAIGCRRRFAEEGADIIAVDLCAQIDSVVDPMTTSADLEQTLSLVEKTGRRIITEQADVRDLDMLKAVVARGVSELGRNDFVLANAGILPSSARMVSRHRHSSTRWP